MWSNEIWLVYGISTSKSNNNVTFFILFDEYDADNCMIELVEANACDDWDDVDCVDKIIPGLPRQEYHNEPNSKLSKRNTTNLGERIIYSSIDVC